MNVASLELCKELYELSGWSGTSSVLQYYVYQTALPSKQRRDIRDKWRLENIMRINEDYGVGAITDTESFVAAYDLGYLLRKLPNGTNVMYNSERSAASYEVAIGEVLLYGKTPEDAACKLAIELFKQGVLEKRGLA